MASGEAPECDDPLCDLDTLEDRLRLETLTQLLMGDQRACEAAVEALLTTGQQQLEQEAVAELLVEAETAASALSEILVPPVSTEECDRRGWPVAVQSLQTAASGSASRGARGTSPSSSTRSRATCVRRASATAPGPRAARRQPRRADRFGAGRAGPRAPPRPRSSMAWSPRTGRGVRRLRLRRAPTTPPCATTSRSRIAAAARPHALSQLAAL